MRYYCRICEDSMWMTVIYLDQRGWSRMDSITGFVSKNTIEDNRNQCAGGKDHSTKETFIG